LTQVFLGKLSHQSCLKVLICVVFLLQKEGHLSLQTLAPIGSIFGANQHRNLRVSAFNEWSRAVV
jgi:hypothetical protein